MQELLPEKRFLYFPLLARVAGSAPLAARLPALRPDIHLFGHTHFSWDATLHGQYFSWSMLRTYPEPWAPRKNHTLHGQSFPWLMLRAYALSPRPQELSARCTVCSPVAGVHSWPPASRAASGRGRVTCITRSMNSERMNTGSTSNNPQRAPTCLQVESILLPHMASGELPKPAKQWKWTAVGSQLPARRWLQFMRGFRAEVAQNLDASST